MNDKYYNLITGEVRDKTEEELFIEWLEENNSMDRFNEEYKKNEDK